MAKSEKAGAQPAPEQVVNLTTLLSSKSAFAHARVWLIGRTPLITHAWSEKAKKEMLAKQVKSVKSGRALRDPETDFNDSLYEIGICPKVKRMAYGFPAMGIKNAILSVAHKDKGIARSQVMQSLWIEAPIVRTRPALASAVCDMPLLRIYGTPPEMREDMVKIGAGLNKVANLAYRGQFRHWAMRLAIRFNPVILPAETLTFLIEEAGMSTGIGEWRNEKKGVFGSFRIATEAEEMGWAAYAEGKGELPISADHYAEAA